MLNNQPLYDKANRIMSKITSIKNITKKVVEDKKKGASIDKKEILKLLYQFRFLNRIQIQAFLKHKNKKRIK